MILKDGTQRIVLPEANHVQMYKLTARSQLANPYFMLKQRSEVEAMPS